MITLTRLSSLVGVLTVVSLLGAGCSTNNPVTDNATNTAPNNNAISTQPGVNTSSTSVVVPVDTTGWQTYQNKTLGFQFQYPIRGSFAPEFSVKLLPLNSSQVKDDCYAETGLPGDTPERLTTNGTAFCRTRILEGAAGSTVNHEYWVTTTEKWYAIIEFTKKYVTDPRIIGGCEDGGPDVGKPRCQAFDINSYKKQVEDIMSTFSYPKS